MRKNEKRGERWNGSGERERDGYKIERKRSRTEKSSGSTEKEEEGRDQF